MKKAFNPTPSQSAAICAKGSVTVTASAGSGKTAVLTKRVLNLITGPDAIDADRLLVVTFTNAAAEEMHNRIKNGMLELLEKDPENEELIRQQALLSKAKITTIDSFCIGLVRENFYKLNLSPDFKPADKGRLDAIKQEAISETLEGFYKQNDLDFQNMLTAFGDGDSDMNTVDAVFTVYEYMCSLPFPFEWLDGAVRVYETVSPEKSDLMRFIVEDSYKKVIYVLNNIDSVLRAVDMPTSFFDKVSADKNSLLNIARALKEGDYDKIRFAVLGFSGLYKTTTSSKFSEDDREMYNLVAERVINLYSKLKVRFECSKEQLSEDVALLKPIMMKFSEIIREFHNLFMQKKAEAGVYSFSDIERMALSLLVKNNDGELSPTEDALTISKQIEEVMVDEYQDTNDLQDMIFRILSDDGRKLFTVGDAKQSIYRFRQANPKNFINRIEHCNNAENAEVITLSENFRSRNGVCEFANFIFSSLMSKQVGDIDYTDNNQLCPRAEYPQKQEPDIIADIVDKGNMSNSVASALRIVDTIKEMMGKECVTDKSTGTLRKARFSDFTVLAPKREGFSEMGRVLAENGIPVWIDEDPPLCEAKEVVWALSVLKVVCNPTLDIPFLSAMLSPAFDFSPEQAAQIKIIYKGNNLYERVKKAADDKNEKASFMLETVYYLRKQINTLPFNMFMQKLYEKTGLLAFVSALDNGAQRKANLIRLAELAGEYEIFSGDSEGFANYIEHSEKSILCPKIVNDTDDVVKLMTIHRSKGLEFNVVFLTSLVSLFNTGEVTSRLQFDRNLGIGLKITDRERKLVYSPFSREAIIASCEASSKSESVRLLYVALTRASEVVYMLFPTDNPEKLIRKNALKSNFLFSDSKVFSEEFYYSKSFADMLLPILLIHGDVRKFATDLQIVTRLSEYTVPVLFKISGVSEVAEPKNEESKNLSCPDVVQLMKQKLEYYYPYAQLNGIASKYAVTSMIERGVDREYFYTTRPEFESAKGLTPSERGTAMHKFLEVCDFSLAYDNLEEEIERLSQNGFMSQKQAESLDRQKLRLFFDSPLYQRICNADKVYREFRFMTEEPALKVDPTLSSDFLNERVVIQGIADCIIEENGVLTVIDYKTDRVNNMEDLASRYFEQLEIYSDCIEKCLKKRVFECVIYSLFKNDTVNLRKV